MGRLTYEHSTKVEIEDRALAHLQFVICDKLRRDESFLLSWMDDPSVGSGRTSVWVHAHAALVFKFYGSRHPELNRNWLEALAQTANSIDGLRLIPEPAAHESIETGAAAPA